MKSMSVFYMPRLLERSVGTGLPPGVAFFPSGLARAGEKEVFSPAEEAVAKALPLPAPEAAAALGEMLRLGEEYARDGLLRQLAAQRAFVPDESAQREELADVAAFAQGKGLPQAGSDVPDWGGRAARAAAGAEKVRLALIDCQRVLLLAQALEERALELELLGGRLAKAQMALAAALHEDDGDDGEASGLPPGGADTLRPQAPAVPWQAVVDAALAFLPENGLLFTADEDMALALREAGMLQPFPQDRVFICENWPEQLAAGLLYASVPGYRLTGRKSLPEDRPWLAREVEVFAARPERGWAVASETEPQA